MKKKTEIIIALISTFLFFYLAAYVSIILFGEVGAGAPIKDLVNTGLVLLVLTSLSLFSFLFTLDYLKSYNLLTQKLVGVKVYKY